MYSGQLRRALIRHPLTRAYYFGVFARNTVPPIPFYRDVAFIVNTDPLHKPGQHWVAFFVTSDTVYYFDPYGRKPRGFDEIFNSRNNRLYFNKRIQGNGRTCGHYCLYFILSMVSSETLNVFSSDLNSNDRYVRRFISENFAL